MPIKKTNNIQRSFVGVAVGMAVTAVSSAVGAAVANAATLAPTAASYIAAVCLAAGAFSASKYAGGVPNALYSGGGFLILWLLAATLFGNITALPLIAAAVGVAAAVLMSLNRKPNARKRIKKYARK